MAIEPKGGTGILVGLKETLSALKGNTEYRLSSLGYRKSKRDIWGGEYLTSGLSFSEMTLFAEIWAEGLRGKNPYTPTEYTEKLTGLKEGPLALKGNTEYRLKSLGNKMHMYYEAASSLTEALFNKRYNCASATALSLMFLEMTDFEEFSKSRVGILLGRDEKPGHILLKLESSGDDGFAAKYKNFDFGVSPLDSSYKSVFGENPKVRPKHYAILSCLAWKADALAGMSAYEEAIQCCDMAIRLGPEEAGYLTYKAIILSIMEKYDEALKCYERALGLDPSNKDILEQRDECLKMLCKAR